MGHDKRTGFLEAAWLYVSLAVPIAALSILIPFAHPVFGNIVTDTLIKLIMVLGLYIFVGNSGVLSFGHGAFAIIGAYASAWMTIPLKFKLIILPNIPAFIKGIHLDPVLGGLVAVLLVAVAAFVLGLVLMRLSGIAASIATFAFFNVIVVIYNNWTSWTKGTASLVGLPVYTGPKVALVAALVALLVALAFQRSRFGLLLRATREDAAAARAAGVRVERMRLVAFVLSATLVGVGGVLQGHFIGALTTTANVYLNLTFLTLAMLVVGGLRSLTGAVVGVAVVAIVAEVLRQLERGWQFGDFMLVAPSGLGQVILGLIMLVILLLRPDGLTRGFELPSPAWLRRAKPSRSH